MKTVRAINHVIRIGSDKLICVAMTEDGGKQGAAIINALIQEAYDLGRKDEQGEPWRVSPFDDENEAPLIDVPEGSDEPDYGPEKIPPRPVYKLTVDELPMHKHDI